MPALGLRTEDDEAAEPVEPSPTSEFEGTGSPAHKERHVAVLAVAGVMLVGAALRLVVTNAYLPSSHNLDEIRNVEEAEAMLDQTTVRQAGYNYPSLLYDVQLVVLGAASIFSSDDDTPVFDTQTPGTAVAERPGELRALRLVTGFIPGVAMVGLAAAIAWVISRRWWPTTLAAALAALSPIDVLFGSYVSPDALSGAASIAAVLAATLVASRPSTMRYVVAGALVGIAAGAKYNCVLTALPLVVAHFVGNRQPFAEWRKLAYSGFTTLGLFLLTTPSALITPIELAVGFASVYRNYSVRGQFNALGNSPAVQLSWLWYGFGLALVAVPLCFLARRPVLKLSLVPLSFCLLYPAVLATPKTGYARNLLPVTGVIASVAALGVYAAYQTLRERVPASALFGTAAAVVISGAVLALPAAHAYSALDAADEDPWSETQEWMQQNLPPGTVVAIESWAPVIDDDRFVAVPTESLGDNPLGLYGVSGVDVVVTTSKRNRPYLSRPDRDPDGTAVFSAVLEPGCRLFEASGGLDPVGGTDRPESVEIVVASVPDCLDLAAADRSP